MQVPYKRCGEASTSVYLRQFDMHTHSFSHCVLKYRGHEDVEDAEGWPLEKKLDYISLSLTGIFTAAKHNGVVVLAINEHPQFGRYNIPFRGYNSVFENVRSDQKFRDSLNILLGIEIDIKRERERIFADVEEIRDAAMGYEQILGGLDFVIYSVHFKQFAEPPIRDNEEYLGVLLAAIEDRKKVAALPCILGHPWRTAEETNIKAHNGERRIGFFNETQLDQLAAALIRGSVIPEFNTAVIREGWSDIRSQEPCPDHTILETYIAKCISLDKLPLISAGSDDHKTVLEGEATNTSTIGVREPEIELIQRKVPNIGNAIMWYESIIR